MVGGPIFGVFSLGLFFPFANEPGALAGLLTGLAIALVMGFGGPKPPNFPLALHIDSCPATVSSTTLLTSLASNVTTTGQPTEYFYLFRVSYLYYIVISFVVTLLVGLAVSGLVSTRGRPSKDLNPDLFVPPLANYLRKKKLERELELNSQEKRENDSNNVSIHL
ncbi:hypothetical protein J6590_013662 [Homalodisca vitripennis]|nr:hypothetical protein J6590_013662 [Homalodisca vitripennis]